MFILQLVGHKFVALLFYFLIFFLLQQTISPYLYSAIKNDYVATGKCDFQIIKKSYMDLQLSIGVAKKSPFLDDFNKG